MAIRYAAALSVLVFGVSAAEAQTMLDLDGDLVLGPALQAERVTVWPVFSKKPHEKIGADLVPLPDAQAQGWAVVREQGGGDASPAAPPQAPLPQRRDPAGEPVQQQVQRRNATDRNVNEIVQQRIDGPRGGPTVNELVIENKGQRPIIVLAGTLLKGGNQDRQVGQDFVVPEGKTVPVSAFCVEHGRWNAAREGQQTGGVFEVKKALATKKVRGSAQFKGSQQEVWNEVAAENAKAGNAPSTGTFMATLEEDDGAAKARRDKLQSTLTGVFAGVGRFGPEPVGLAYAVDGKVREVRVFSHPAVFKRLQDTLLTTVALEGDLAHREAQAAGRKEPPPPAEAKQVVELVRGSSEAPEERQTTKSGNLVKMRKSKATWAAETYLDDAAPAPMTRTFTAAE